VVTITTSKGADLIRELERAGWTLRRTVGSHHIFVHSTLPGHVTVPHPKEDLGNGLVHKIRKQAGLK
jgi:predicted RNA binding protein YcfA (HicA-like mRNA interferase family)